MGMHRKTITLTEQQEKERLATLRQALVEGEASGEPKPLDIAAIKAAQLSAKRYVLFRLEH